MSKDFERNFPEVIMEARSVTKVYPGTVALKNVDFKIYKGMVNVLIGQNGAGKSTLMRLLAGIEQQTEGEIFLNGKQINLNGPVDASDKGIGMIHQELNLFPELSVMQNIFMNQENVKARGLIIDDKKNSEMAERILKKLEHEIGLRTRVGDLRMGQQQIIEIAKTMVHENTQVLIMDEPTSSLSKAEVNILFKLINELKQHNIAIIYISHRMEEILQVGDYVTVLRDGQKVEEAWISDIDISWMVRSMVGKTQENIIKKKSSEIGERILKVEHLSLPSEAGGYLLEDVSFELRKGEIIGIYGLLGSGRTELFETLMGMHPEATLDLYLEDKKINPKSIREQIKNGLFMVPEDRKDAGLIHTLSIEENLVISSLENYTTYGMIDKKREGKATDDAIKNLSIKANNKKLPIFSLSGGNQQKVVIGKGVMTNPKILLMDEPTRGIDVAAKEEVFRMIFDFAAQGCGIIVIASEIGEILRVSDRVIILSGGRMTAELSMSEVTEERLVKASEQNLAIHAM